MDELTAAPAPPPKKYLKRSKKRGKISQAEKNLVAAVVGDAALEPTPKEVRAIAVSIRRPVEVVKALVEEARGKFLAKSSEYVDIHSKAVKKALNMSDPKALEVAVRGSQWAIEHISADGTRIVEKDAKSEGGVRVMVGVKIGGLNGSQNDV